jgi:hypothetical protein
MSITEYNGPRWIEWKATKVGEDSCAATAPGDHNTEETETRSMEVD